MSKIMWLTLLIMILIIGALSRTNRSGQTAQVDIVVTHTEIQVLAMVLDEHFESNLKLLANNNASIRAALSATSTNASKLVTLVRTNSTGEMVDSWNVPYRIQIIGTTNFIIRSGGPNKKFNDRDDIIYDSIQ